MDLSLIQRDTSENVRNNQQVNETQKQKLTLSFVMVERIGMFNYVRKTMLYWS